MMTIIMKCIVPVNVVMLDVQRSVKTLLGLVTVAHSETLVKHTEWLHRYLALVSV